MIDALEELDGYAYLHAARADLLRRLGRDDEAAGELPRGARADRQRGRAALPRAAPARGRRHGRQGVTSNSRAGRRFGAARGSDHALDGRAVAELDDRAPEPERERRSRRASRSSRRRRSPHDRSRHREIPRVADARDDDMVGPRVGVRVRLSGEDGDRRPPAAFAPRWAAAMTSPSPPVTTVQPRSASRRPTSSASATTAPLPTTATCRASSCDRRRGCRTGST